MITSKLLDLAIQSHTQEGVQVIPVQKIEVTEITDPVTTIYDVDFLLSQKAAIQKQAADFAKARQAELDRIDEILNGAGVQPIGKLDEIK